MKYVIGIAIIAALFGLATQLHQSCGDLEHTPLDKMDTATQDFYIQNCR